jgi:hypothetical protein
MAYLPIKPGYNKNPYFSMEDELKIQTPAAPSAGTGMQQPQQTPIGAVKTPQPTTTEQPQERFVGSIITAIAGIATAAIGAGVSAEASDEAMKQQEKLEKKRMEEEKKEREKQRKERGLQTLAEQRYRAQESAKTRVFNKKFLQAYAQKAIGGPGVTTLGGV